MNAMSKTMTGQILLIVCCVFYLIWWSISFRPGVAVNRMGGVNGILLFITALCGFAGVILTVNGMNSLKMTAAPKLNGMAVVIAGVILYIVLLFVTRIFFDRPVTTELVLITAWAVMEICVVNSLCGAGRLSDAGFCILLAVIAAAFVVSMILYVLYYRMEEMKAFYAAMVPLITEAVSMGVIVAVSLL